MAISIVGTPTSGTASVTSSVTVNKPTGVASGDLLLACHNVDWGSYSDMTAPAGWTLVDGHDETGASGGHAKLWRRTADGTEGSSFTFNQNAGADGAISLIALRGHEATPTIVVAKSANATDTAPSVTPTGSDDFLICAATSSQDDNLRTYTAPSGMTERTDASTTYASQSLATLQLASSSATGTKDFANSGAGRSGHQAQFSVAVQTDGGGGGGTTHAIASTGTGTSTGSLAVRLVQKASSTGTGSSTGSAVLLLAPGRLSATGTGTTTGSVNLTIVGGSTTHALSSTGTGTSTGSSDVTHIRGLSATGSSSSTGSLAVELQLDLSSTGTGQTAGSLSLSSTLEVSASGSGATAGSLALGVIHPLTATGDGTSAGSLAVSIVVVQVHDLAATGAGQTSGSVVVELVEPEFFFSPPTHEEPIRYGHDTMRPAPRPLNYYRLTYAASVVKVNGTWTPMRTPPPELLEGLVDGVDYFRGGYEYVIDRAAAQDLAAAGYTASQI